MQLFELAKEEMKEVAEVAERVKVQAKAKGKTVLPDVTIPLNPIKIDDDQDTPLDPKQNFPGLDLIVQVSHPEVDIDRERVIDGVRGFMCSALFYAYNPLERGVESENPNALLLGSQDDISNIAVRFGTFDVDTFSSRAPMIALDAMEIQMFANWKDKRGSKDAVLKTFASEDECDRIRHLFCCMAMAANLSDEKIKRSFLPQPNDHTIVMKREFLSQMVDFEQTMESNLKSSARG